LKIKAPVPHFGIGAFVFMERQECEFS
jgi:hypothetical protein